MSNLEPEVRLNAFFDTLTVALSSQRQVFPPAAERLCSRMRKRAGFVNPDLDSKAKFDFLMTNLSLKDFEISLPADILSEARYFILRTLENVTTGYDELNVQRSLDRRYLFENWRFGPGASYDVHGTHTAEKIDQAMTCTELCEPNVKRLRTGNPYFTAADSVLGDSGYRTVLGSKLSTVPKNEDAARTIAIEPSGNMALQLAAGKYLEDALRYLGLDIRSQQPRNKRLACIGSIDGSLATLDLSKASDLISLDLVRQLLPSDWYQLVVELRSPAIRVNGEWVPLNMVSTMGNGFTFPLMTLIIVSLVYANRRINHSGPSLYINWDTTAVFGDDIIIPVKECSNLIAVLHGAGFVVNTDKSYSEGPFRESCGGDYWNGVDITPFYIRSLATDADIYVAINQLLLWSARHKFWPISSYKLLLTFLRTGPHFVPFWCQPTGGIHTTRVSRRYTFLRPVIPIVPYKGAFGVPLACGGYLGDNGLGTHFVPRPRGKVRYVPKKARLPRGYLDGGHPAYVGWRSLQSAIDLIIDIS